MKLSHFRPAPRAGFTLVELLVVIAIIAILASVVVVAVSSAINAAKRAKTSAFATNIQTAVMNYYTEYGVYPVQPVAGAATDTLFQTKADWQPLAIALDGGVDPGNPTGGQVAGNPIPNTRQIAYLTTNKSDLDTTGGTAVPKTAFKDAKGNPQYFYLAVDSDYSNILGDSNAQAAPPDFASAVAGATTLPATKPISGGVAVWANCDPATNGGVTHPNLWVHTF